MDFSCDALISVGGVAGLRFQNVKGVDDEGIEDTWRMQR